MRTVPTYADTELTDLYTRQRADREYSCDDSHDGDSHGGESRDENQTGQPIATIRSTTSA